MKRKYSNLFRIFIVLENFPTRIEKKSYSRWKKILLEVEKNPTRDGKFSYYLYIIYLARLNIVKILSKFSINFSHNFCQFSLPIAGNKKILNLFYFTSKPHLIIPYPVLIFKIVPRSTPYLIQ